ncbi:MAG TPA: FtsQ-type POTRA domain-containing protein [Gemmatimonadaceae bacterium]
MARDKGERGTDLSTNTRHGVRPSESLLTTPLKVAMAGIAVLLIAGSPSWAPLLLRRSGYFRVRRVEIVGAHYVAPGDILGRLRLDTTASIWDSPAPLIRRLAGNPEIERAEIHRRFPGTLVVDITERVPVALVPAIGGFRVYDSHGVSLPIDPARVAVDAPVVMQRDTAVLRLLGEMRHRMPTMYSRVSAVRRVGDGELVFQFAAQPVRAMQDVTLDRLADIEPVEADLRRKQLRVSEIDLRYRDQVIARVQ